MALQQSHKTHYLTRAKEYGLPDTHPLVMKIKRGDESAVKDLENFFEQVYKSGRAYDPYKNEDIGVKKYGMDAVKNFVEPEGSIWTGKDSWRENVPLYSPEQTEYMNNSLKFAEEKMPQLYEQLSKRANGGLLTEMFGNNASQGFENLIGKLGGLEEYAPQAIGSALGSYSNGGGLGGILQALIGSAAGQYTSNKIGNSTAFNNISQGIGNYYNQGMGALGDLLKNGIRR